VAHGGREQAAVGVAQLQVVRERGQNRGVALRVAVGADVSHEGVDNAELRPLNLAAIGEAKLRFLGAAVLRRHAGEEVEVLALRHLVHRERGAGGVGLLGAQAHLQGHFLDVAAERSVGGAHVFAVDEVVGLAEVGSPGLAGGRLLPANVVVGDGGNGFQAGLQRALVKRLRIVGHRRFHRVASRRVVTQQVGRGGGIEGAGGIVVVAVFGVAEVVGAHAQRLILA
nr:hypothetical protein [Tanacetum cinerariifolium]